MIKFRAWDKLSNMMYTPTSIELINGEVVQADIEDNSLNISDDLNTLLLEQFTGLKDVNGKDIYEGDILKTKAGLIQIVEEGILAIDREDIISGFYANNLSDDKPHTFSYDDEVIGNVHANPELLEAEK